MKVRALLKRFRRFRLKQRLRAVNYAIPFATISVKKKPMTEKQKKREQIKELQDTLDEYILQQTELVKVVGTLRKEVAELQKSNTELKQLCKLGE